MIPLKDLSPRRSVPIVTILLIIANALVFFYQIGLPPRAAAYRSTAMWAAFRRMFCPCR